MPMCISYLMDYWHNQGEGNNLFSSKKYLNISFITNISEHLLITLYYLRIAKKYSFSKKHIALSAICKCGPEMHLITLLKSFSTNILILSISQTSKTSINSLRNNYSFTEFANGQYFSSASTNSWDNSGIFERNSIVHRCN